MSTLPEGEILERMGALPRWQRRGHAIERTFDCKNFNGSMTFVNAVAQLANEADHHPDIAVSWNDVTLTLSSHDAGGLTERDFSLAPRIDALYAQR